MSLVDIALSVGVQTQSHFIGVLITKRATTLPDVQSRNRPGDQGRVICAPGSRCSGCAMSRARYPGKRRLWRSTPSMTSPAVGGVASRGRSSRGDSLKHQEPNHDH
jgi:hypothetical protein